LTIGRDLKFSKNREFLFRSGRKPWRTSFGKGKARSVVAAKPIANLASGHEAIIPNIKSEMRRCRAGLATFWRQVNSGVRQSAEDQLSLNVCDNLTPENMVSFLYPG
jgi:hypothetical protein